MERLADYSIDYRGCFHSGLFRPQCVCHSHRHDAYRLDQWSGSRCGLWDLCGFGIPVCSNNGTYVDLGQKNENPCVAERVVAEMERAAIWCERLMVTGRYTALYSD